jgi:Cu(I)/Ag(I) efflux system periplasmic protein CusF
MIRRMRKKFAISALACLTSMPLLATDMTDGEVRKVDLEQGKVTLRHEEIKDLDMPRMTMVFVVKDKAQLAKLKPGDKVKFRAVNDAGKITVTDIQTVP